MARFNSHVSFIQTHATNFPQRLAFKLPQFEIDDGKPHRKIIGWTEITYEKFYRDIVQCGGYWLQTLQCPPRSVIGLWDFVHLFGLTRAGLIPQVLNLRINSVEIATTYFKQSNIEHIIYAPTAPIDPLRDHFQTHEIIDIEQTYSQQGEFTVPELNEEDGNDTIFIYHTSGSTAGQPKLIPYLRRWIDGNSRKPLFGLPDGKETGIALNGVVHLSQFSISLQQFRNSACLVLVPWLDFTGEELVQIITECKANALYQLTPFLTAILQRAMTKKDLAAALQSLSFIPYGGGVCGENERRWAKENNVPIMNIYGGTEIGMAMMSGSDTTILHPLVYPGLVYEFRSLNPDDAKENDSNRLVEMVLAPSSLDCPHPSLCDPIDGYYHTRDVFQQVTPDGFKFRGRLEDFIKMKYGEACDTIYIETQVMLSCKDLVSACVVVGTGKPSPVLLVELLEDTVNPAPLKENIGKKVELINEDGFTHERIRPSDIIIVRSGSLPRTGKGTIKRAEAEQLFQQSIDVLFDE
ncbi:hypothetical protein Clacol_007837 [Clathrus columnatus]|uniref:AMP-dependent synthetase/ligase domain-containing protein n=1 Tax=Clathrus columnatus TaxID=1419009 RepID=A0AAV5AMC1_9AGAM|nr:hypothetical protein Clacol_007837 [Clathrus columnatus]